MMLDLVLNELSLESQATDIYTARQLMSQLIQTIIFAKKKGAIAFRVQSDLTDKLLAPNYQLVQWRNDEQVDQVERQYFRTLQIKYPFLTDYKDLIDKNWLYNFTYNNLNAEGFGAAYHLDALSISLRTHDQWNVNKLDVLVEWIEEGGLCEFEAETVSINHASSEQHITDLDEWITKRSRSTIQSGTDLWDQRGNLWTSLIFCREVEEQLKSLGKNHQMLPHIWKRLDCFEEYCLSWEPKSSFNRDLLDCKASPESESTMNQKPLVKARTFLCPDGNERVFEWHVKISLNFWRIHFFPLPETRQIIIGYIGEHLPTATNPT